MQSHGGWIIAEKLDVFSLRSRTAEVDFRKRICYDAMLTNMTFPIKRKPRVKHSSLERRHGIGIRMG